MTAVRSTPPLSCTVRDCGLLLEKRAGGFACARHHAYDIAQSGYVNLLQPQDRRSRSAGDAPPVVAARARLLAGGVGDALVSSIVDRAVTLAFPAAVIADLGSGAGDVLGRLVQSVPCTAVGIDLSIAAADTAARRFPAVTWVVANVDRRLPLLDRSVDLIVSVHGRRNPSECARVLTAAGELLIAIPAPDDLIELRAAIQGRGVERDRVQTLVQEHADDFELADQFESRHRRRIGAAEIRDLLRSTYRGARRSATPALERLDALDVTLSSVVTVLRRRTPRSRTRSGENPVA